MALSETTQQLATALNLCVQINVPLGGIYFYGLFYRFFSRATYFSYEFFFFKVFKFFCSVSCFQRAKCLIFFPTSLVELIDFLLKLRRIVVHQGAELSAI